MTGLIQPSLFQAPEPAPPALNGRVGLQLWPDGWFPAEVRDGVWYRKDVRTPSGRYDNGAPFELAPGAPEKVLR